VEKRCVIGEVARRLALNPKTIRYYEQVGLIAEPERSGAGYRLYRHSDEERLRFIATARRAGFTLGEIKEMLALRDEGRPPCSYVAATVERKLGEVDRQLIELRQLKQELTALRRKAATLRPTVEEGIYCHLLEGPSDGNAAKRD
jgi:DNA-binding transcriptional MerR regulator